MNFKKTYLVQMEDWTANMLVCGSTMMETGLLEGYSEAFICPLKNVQVSEQGNTICMLKNGWGQS